MKSERGRYFNFDLRKNAGTAPQSSSSSLVSFFFSSVLRSRVSSLSLFRLSMGIALKILSLVSSSLFMKSDFLT